MKRIYIFGVGKGKDVVKENLIVENTELLGYIDNNAKAYPEGIDGKRVFLPEETGDDFDYIIVSVMRFRLINEQLLSMGIQKDRVIDFFSFSDAITAEYWYVLEKNVWRIEALSYEFEKKVRPISYNYIYEAADSRYKTNIVYPNILPAEKAVELILKERKSLVRFGDGEFELMQMRKRAGFQSVDAKLANRLKEILRCHNENILVAIADIYGSLEKYTEEAAEDIREYMTPQVRQEHMGLLHPDKLYYDAYLSRPYIIYKEKELAEERFCALRKIWEEKDILVVEGDKTRMGAGNNLFDNARSVKRILAPNENAFTKYEEILGVVKQVAKNELILIALGPTATVLAYDLAVDGLWAIDIGHLDLEYEWYCSHTMQRQDISYKYVGEIGKGEQVSELPDNFKLKYNQEIIYDLA